MTDDQGYNGWKNYETWSVALIINNDQALQGESFDITREAIERADDQERPQWSVGLALKDWVERSCEALDVSDREPWSYLWSQLISAALSDVDWVELADHWIADLEQVEA